MKSQEQRNFEAALKRLERSGRVTVTLDEQGRKVYRLKAVN